MGLGVLAFWRFEGSAPVIDVTPKLQVGQGGVTLPIEIRDEGSGLRSVEVRLLYPGGGKTLEQKVFRGGLMEGGGPVNDAFELDLDPEKLGIPDGRSTLIVDVRDWSWADGFAGNRTEQRIETFVDTDAPKPRAATGLLYIHRGGSGALAYQVDEETRRDGVRVGDAFFPGFPRACLDGNEVADRSAGERVAIFAIPVDAPANVDVLIEAEDLAGNIGTGAVSARLLAKRFPDVPINLSNRFLEDVASGLAKENGLAGGSPADEFRRVNEELRERNEAQIRELLAEARSERCAKAFEGAFAQLANSAVRGRFAEQRSYLKDGKKISEAVHYGYDLASTANAPITAANSGRVIYTGDLGIYGQAILVDHGLGLVSLYGHLADIDVQPGQAVVKGEKLGRSGASGLAAGDHLHFALLVGNTYVEPLEWWDASWIRSHIDARLGKRAS